MVEVFRIGAWRFDPSDPVLRSENEARALEDRSARTLAVLCARRGEVVSKEDLIEAVWQGRVVSANSVAVVIGGLRRALGEDPRNPAHIQTVGKRGYRLSPEPPAARAAGHPRWPWPAVTGVGLAIVWLIGAALAFYPPPTTIRIEPVRNDTGAPELENLARTLDFVVADSASRLAGGRVVAGSEGDKDKPEPDLLLQSRLIIWAGAPELSMSATDQKSGVIVWSGFAAGPAALLARHIDDRLRTLQVRLRR